MVKTMKGAGYTIEAIVAIATIFIFVFGSLNVPPNQDWTQFREQTSANDLTYTLQQTGHIEHAIKNGEIGSIQTAFSSVTERDVEVSGLISNLPINENKIAFYTTDINRFTQQLTPVQSTDQCYDDLEEISTRTNEQILRSSGGELGVRDNTTYIADLDPNTVGGDGELNYDSLWVDNGTACQFSDEEGPYNIEEIFKWQNQYYDIKSINSDTEEMTLYQATQPMNFKKALDQRVNGVKTFTTIDTVNFTRLNERQYNTVIFRQEQSLNDINSTENRQIVEEFIQTGSILFLADLDSTYFNSGRFLNDAGFKYVDVSYEGYSGQPTQGVFSNNDASQETFTYFKGLGEPSPLSIKPSTTVISNTESSIQSGEAILKASQNYDFSSWEANVTSMTPTTTGQGEPESECYSKTRALTETTINLAGEEYNIINAELGSTTSYCNNNDDRAIEIDLDDDGNYDLPEEGPYLSGEYVDVGNITYGINIKSDASPGCNEGSCVEFIFIGDRAVELIPRRTAFPGFQGQRIALTGYEPSYSDADLKLLASVIYWLRGDQTRFTGNQDPEGISTSTFSGIQNQTYMPYEANIRWSR